MGQKPNQRILKAIKEIRKLGWVFYYRGKPDAEISVNESLRRGPVKTLKDGVLYMVLPHPITHAVEDSDFAD